MSSVCVQSLLSLTDASQDIPDKDKTADDRKKEKEAQDNARQIKKLRSSCLDCAAAFDVSCDGIPFKKDCSNCKGQNKQCSWPASVAEKPTWKSSSEYAEELKAKSGQHDPPPPQLEEIQFPDLPTSWTNPSIPEKPHVAMLFFLRASSHGGLAQFNQHFANAQATAAFYDQIFDAPNPTNLVGFDIPRGVDGARLPSHIRLYPFARHGARKVPTSTANLDDPILEDFVNYFNTITDPNTPAVQRPVEIHLVTFGIPGLAVDITAFGNSAQGFFGGLRAADRQIGSNYSKTTYVVPMVEAHVVDGLTPASLPGGGQFDPMGSNITLRANGLPPQRWGYWRHKYLQKLSLRHLITRAGVVHSTRHQNFHGNQNLPVAPTYSPQPGLAGMDEQLDRWLDAAFEDMAWRSAWLSLLTVPTATHIANRNVDRNRRMRL